VYFTGHIDHTWSMFYLVPSRSERIGLRNRKGETIHPFDAVDVTSLKAPVYVEIVITAAKEQVG